LKPSPKILVLSGVQGDTRRYRTHHLHEQLRMSDADCVLSHITHAHVLAQAAEAQIIILHRIALDEVSRKLVDAARKRGALLLLDVDDLVFDAEAFRWIDSPDFADPTRARLYLENIRRNRALLERCDALLASTNFLAEAARQLGKPAWVHRNGFSLEMLAHSSDARSNARSARPQGSPGELVIGYASGTRTHDQDFALVRPTLQKILSQHPSVQLLLAGRLDPGDGWESFAGQVRTAPCVPWRQLPRVLAGLDINLAPLRSDNPFCQSKSEIKYMEAALVQVPTIASPTDAFQSAIRPGENGALAASPDEWEQSLNEWIDSPGERQRAGANAWQDVMEHFAPWMRAEQIRLTLNEISATLGYDYCIPEPPMRLYPEGAENAHRLWTSEAEELHPTLVERGLYSLRSRGAGTLAKEIWIYLRRLAEPLFPFKRR
jgi:glycosyltransferase involved in cell wall biosynthesis